MYVLLASIVGTAGGGAVWQTIFSHEELILQEGKQLFKKGAIRNLQRNHQRSPGGDQWTLGMPWQHVGLLEEEANQTAVCVMRCVPRSLIGCPKIDGCSLSWRNIHQDPFIILLGDECSLFLLLPKSFREYNSYSSNWCWGTKTGENFHCVFQGPLLSFFTVLDTHVHFWSLQRQMTVFV